MKDQEIIEIKNDVDQIKTTIVTIEDKLEGVLKAVNSIIEKQSKMDKIMFFCFGLGVAAIPQIKTIMAIFGVGG
jgi:t-SNARE complex subunit (syntaxin)